jgi:hypothetical protein
MQIWIGAVVSDTQSSRHGLGWDGEGHCELTFFLLYCWEKRRLVGGGWLGGGSVEGGEVWQKVRGGEGTPLRCLIFPGMED